MKEIQEYCVGHRCNWFCVWRWFAGWEVSDENLGKPIFTVCLKFHKERVGVGGNAVRRSMLQLLFRSKESEAMIGRWGGIPMMISLGNPHLHCFLLEMTLKSKRARARSTGKTTQRYAHSLAGNFTTDLTWPITLTRMPPVKSTVRSKVGCFLTQICGIASAENSRFSTI